MRQIDSMSSDEIEVLKLKGMLANDSWEQAIHDANMERDDYHLRDDGRSDGHGESYAERNL